MRGFECSADAGTGLDRFVDGHHDHIPFVWPRLSTVGGFVWSRDLLEIAGGEDHALADLASKFSGLQIRHDHDLLAHECRRLVPRLDARADLAPLWGAVIEGDLQELVRIGMQFAGRHGGDSEVELREEFEVDVRKGFDGAHGSISERSGEGVVSRPSESGSSKSVSLIGGSGGRCVVCEFVVGVVFA